MDQSVNDSFCDLLYERLLPPIVALIQEALVLGKIKSNEDANELLKNVSDTAIGRLLEVERSSNFAAVPANLRLLFWGCLAANIDKKFPPNFPWLPVLMISDIPDEVSICAVRNYKKLRRERKLPKTGFFVHTGKNKIKFVHDAKDLLALEDAWSGKDA